MSDPVKELPRLTSEHLRSFAERRCPDPKNCHQCKMDADIEQYVRAIQSGESVVVKQSEIINMRDAFTRWSHAFNRWLTTRSNTDD